jgi:Fe2+ transport system protein B
MSDIADSRGLRIDMKMLSQGLKGTPIVPTTANKGKGLDELLQAAIRVAEARQSASSQENRS